jgi:hypothetical protein
MPVAQSLCSIVQLNTKAEHNEIFCMGQVANATAKLSSYGQNGEKQEESFQQKRENMHRFPLTNLRTADFLDKKNVHKKK